MWFRIRYTLPIHDDGKPEIVAYRAETEAEAKQRLFHFYDKQARGVYGEPEIVSIEAYDSWDAVKEAIGGMNK